MLYAYQSQYHCDKFYVIFEIYIVSTKVNINLARFQLPQNVFLVETKASFSYISQGRKNVDLVPTIYKYSLVFTKEHIIKNLRASMIQGKFA